MSNESSLISKIWNFANVLRDDGVGYGDYLEQISYLLFLKMADEIAHPLYCLEREATISKMEIVRILRYFKYAKKPIYPERLNRRIQASFAWFIFFL